MSRNWIIAGVAAVFLIFLVSIIGFLGASEVGIKMVQAILSAAPKEVAQG